MSTVVAATLLLAVMAYAIFGGADFGAGFWDLTAGGAARGKAPRHLIDHSMGPVWEANHTWLIFCLVVFWTAFPGAFAAVMSTLYLPLGLAVLGIVLRGSGFAFRKVVVRTDHQRLNGAVFATSSVITPFFLGTVGGSIVAGRVPAAGGGDPVASWVNPTSLVVGVLAVAVCAYLAAVFLTADARRVGDRALETWFRRRAWAAAWVTGALALVALFGIHTEAPRVFGRLAGRVFPIPAVSVLAGALALALLGVVSPRIVRLLAATAVGALVIGWGAAQYPYLLGTHTTVASAAAPPSSLDTLTVIIVIAAILVIPSLGLLYVLQQRSQLEGE